MIWEIHSGDRQFRNAGEPNQHPLTQVEREPMCAACYEVTIEFMQQAADAVRQAGVKPDDQIWLGVFGAMQRVLHQHGGCPLCAEQRVLAEASRGTREQFPTARPVDRLASWRTPANKAR